MENEEILLKYLNEYKIVFYRSIIYIPLKISYIDKISNSKSYLINPITYRTFEGSDYYEYHKKTKWKYRRE